MMKENSCSATAHSTEPKAKVPRYGKPSSRSNNLATSNIREKPGYQTYSSKTYTNSAMAEKRNLVKESDKKQSSYSQVKSSQKVSVSSSTSDRGPGGNQGRATGSLKEESTVGV